MTTAQSQAAGATAANLAEVESGTLAMRATLRIEDCGLLGCYTNGGVSALDVLATPMAAGLAANSPIFSMRWSHATNLCLVKRLLFSASNAVTAFAAGVGTFNLFVARSYSVADTGGNNILPVSAVGAGKLRVGMGNSLMADMRIALTGTLTAGTRTLDTNPVSSISVGILAAANTQICGLVPMLEQRPGEHPLILAQNEGLVLQATVPATGTWIFGVKVDWTEITSY